MGRRIRRVIRRVGREVERTVRRVGDVAGGIPVVGDVLGATGLVETPLMKQQEQAEEEARRQQEALDKAQREREAEEKWQREQQQMSSQIMGTQTPKSMSNVSDNTDLANVLTDNSEENQDDLLKRMMKKK